MAYSVNISNERPPEAKGFVLKLLEVVDGGVLGVAQTVRAATLFGISETSIRVTLARLSQAQLVESVDRGAYRLGPRALSLGTVVTGWRNVTQTVVPWSGLWNALHAGSLPRGDRKSARASDRALSMVGMRELDSGLFIRPDNLRGGVANLRNRLENLGVPADVAVFNIDGFDEPRLVRARNLWDGQQIAQDYRCLTNSLETWLGKRGELEPDDAARQSFLLGDAVIRQILFDPLLPAPMVDEEARETLIKTMIGFDDVGRKIWTTILD